MKNYISWKLLLFCACLFFISCNTASPEKYFDVAVLNSNMLAGFANEGLLRELESPSVKMDAKRETIPMKRDEVISAKIQFLDENFDKLKNLKETTDTKDMLQTSVALYEFVLPVYKTEYKQLARLYDEGAPKEQIESQVLLIHDKYYSRFNELYNKLIAIGKLYAARHSIKVNWGTY